MCDLVQVSKETTEKVRKKAAQQLGIPEENLILSATHNHNGRSAADDLVERIVRAVAQADALAKPVRLEAGLAQQEETISFNRRYLMKDGTVRFNPGPLNPDIVRPVGPIDPEVGILLIRAASDGRPLASIVNFALHACTVGRGGISADYPFSLERSLKGELGPEFVSIYVPGACGDVNHFDVSRPRPGMTVFQGQTLLTPYVPMKTDKSPTPLDHLYIGESLAKTVKAAMPGLKSVDRPSLAVRRQIVNLPLATYSEMDLAWAKETVQKPISFLAGVRARRILSLEEMRRQGDTIPIEVQAIRLGHDTAIVAMPGELFVELGLVLKKGSPFRNTLVVELSGTGRIAYVPTRKAFVEGGYEVINSRLELGGGEKMLETALDILDELKAELN
ncbi:MAG: hypothetical protein GXY83_32735 [Rhodopirellula sp.]|nr:hypothetical protein [Rhodopirellula sp.]